MQSSQKPRRRDGQASRAGVRAPKSGERPHHQSPPAGFVVETCTPGNGTHSGKEGVQAHGPLCRTPALGPEPRNEHLSCVAANGRKGKGLMEKTAGTAVTWQGSGDAGPAQVLLGGLVPCSSHGKCNLPHGAPSPPPPLTPQAWLEVALLSPVPTPMWITLLAPQSGSHHLPS